MPRAHAYDADAELRPSTHVRGDGARGACVVTARNHRSGPVARSFPCPHADQEDVMSLRFARWEIALLSAALLTTAVHAQQAGQGAQNPAGPPGDTQPAGSEPPHPNAGPTRDKTGRPIGAGPETMPAKFDDDVAARDRTAIMARPLPLDDEQKRQ